MPVAKNNNIAPEFVEQCAKWPQKAMCHWYADPVRSHCPWSDDLGILTPVCVWLWLSFIFIVLFYFICSIFVRLFHSFRGALNDNLAIRLSELNHSLSNSEKLVQVILKSLQSSLQIYSVWRECARGRHGKTNPSQVVKLSSTSQCVILQVSIVHEKTCYPLDWGLPVKWTVLLPVTDLNGSLY